ncbi:MAG: epoxyqueuosine reductase, partial [Planctomycetota bacterium]
HFFGCDVCQDVCPWNRRSPFTTEPAFKPRADLDPIDCEAVLAMTEAEFADRFRGTPLDRPGFDGLKKSAALVNENRSAVASK